MSVVPGARLGPYEITAKIGAGGMGEVYRATDTRLKREVALKILPLAFASDHERMARFQREAVLLASLNHPNIATIHGLEDADGVKALVMELVEGEDLSQRIARGAIPVDEALPIAKQVAAALETAHEQGIIHRDLKPANIKVRSEGAVKVLDFGLAKAMQPPAASSPSPSMSPTITTPAMTQAGTILGTAAYMSPEQARGRPVDRRADIWAFGAVLFEMLTGIRAFAGADVQDTFVAILRDAPDWGRLPRHLPPAVATCIKRCLQKDSTQRLQAMGDVRLALEGVFESAASQGLVNLPSPTRLARPVWTAVAAAVLIAGTVVAMSWRRQPALLDLSAYRYRPFAFTSEQEDGGVWSPDGKSVAFLQGSALMVQSLEAAAPTRLVDGAATPLAWSPDGARILFRTDAGIHSISMAGGQPEKILAVESVNQLGSEQRPVYFDLSPDGKTLAVWRYLRAADNSLRSSVWFSPAPGAALQAYTPAPFSVDNTSTPVYLRFSRDGRQLFLSTASASGIWILPFPPGSGPPRRVFGNIVWKGPPNASWMPDHRRLILSGSVAPSVTRALWLADIRDETLLKLSDRPDSQTWPSVSPDGTRVLFTNVREDADIAELPLDGSAPRKLFATSLNEYSPAWSPRGGQFAYVTDRNGGEELWVRSAAGEWDRPVVTQRELPGLRGVSDPAFSPDGTRIAYSVIAAGATGFTLYVSPAVGGTPTRISSGTAPSWSPDGGSIAFVRWKTNGFPLAIVRFGANQQPTEIYSERCESVQWSPSGEWIACGTFSRETVLVSPDGQTHRTLAGIASRVLAWSKDGQTIYGIDTTFDGYAMHGGRALVALDVRSNISRTVVEYGSAIPDFFSRWAWGLQLSRSPDGTSVAIGAASRQMDLWILEGFTPR
jgi:Tol biopolymer transport system component